MYIGFDGILYHLVMGIECDVVKNVHVCASPVSKVVFTYDQDHSFFPISCASIDFALSV